MKLKCLAAILVALVLIAGNIPFQTNTVEASPQTNFRTGLNGIVCLTIDDGYSRKYVQMALDVLRKNHVHCTFFVIGRQLTALADLWRQAVRDGHEICYHSMRHTIMCSWSKERILADLKQWNKTAKSVLGAGYKIPKFARLPGGSGHHSARIQKIFSQLGYKLIYWSADTYTGVIRLSRRNLNARITNYVERTTKKNSVILTHFNCYDAPALSHYIGWLKKHFTLGTVSQAFAKKPVAPAHTPAPSPSSIPSPTAPAGTITGAASSVPYPSPSGLPAESPPGLSISPGFLL